MPSNFNWNQTQLEKKVERVARRVMTEATLLVEREAKRTIQQDPKTGRIYKKPGTNATWQASAPGESPAVRFGPLAKSITHEVLVRRREIVGRVGTNITTDDGKPLGLWLEIGTPGGKIAQRPYLRPSLYKNQSKIMKLFETNRLARMFDW